MTTNSNPNRVLRGGSWSNGAWYCRSAVRFCVGPDFRCQGVGFRPVLKPVPDSGTHDACDECPLPAVHRQQDYNYVMHSFCDACWAMHLEICGNNGSPYRV